MNCLVVDDNIIARTTLTHLASQVHGLEVKAECATALEAFNIMQEQQIDLLLLDIEMPGMSGLELTRNLGPEKPIIIFTTSKKEYAAEAFDLSVADYLLKPITPGRFLQAISKAKAMAAVPNELVLDAADQYLFIRDSNIVKRLCIADILYVEAMGDYVKIHIPGKFFAIHTTLKAVEQRLSATSFIRVHRSYLVAVNRVDTIQDGALVIQGKSVPVADAYRAQLNKRLNIL